MSGEGVWNTARLSHQSLTRSNGVVSEGIGKLLRFPAICSSFRKICPEPFEAFIGDIKTDVLTHLVAVGRRYALTRRGQVVVSPLNRGLRKAISRPN